MNYKAPVDDMRFILMDVWEATVQLKQYGFPEDITDNTLLCSILEEAARLAEQVLLPINHTGDEQGAIWADGKVTLPTSFKTAYHLLGQGGWIGLMGDETYGGMQMPKVLSVLVEEMFFASNTALSMYAVLTMGAAYLLERYASDYLKQTYLPALYDGSITATMCLTEAHAGSDLGLIHTKAIPISHDIYAISGEKIFITGGEHNLTDNIIHLVLARLKGAPKGTQGLSLFLVPKFFNRKSKLIKNHVTCASIEKKMGIKASSTCVMVFDAAEGYLIGSLNQGLKTMFSMMNYERLSIALQGLGLGVASYHTALSYAQTRQQGHNTHRNSPSPVSIIEHGDVKRMLLTMKAFNEAGRALACYTALSLDIEKITNQTMSRISILIPLVKAFLTDIGFEVTVLGQQVLGGHGYISEWGQEQHVRDARIAQIYEGTNGIQGIDLLSRKIIGDQGNSLFEWIDHMHCDVMQSSHSKCLPWITQWNLSITELKKRTTDCIQTATSHWVNGHACTYLQVIGYIAYGYMWIKMANTASKKLAMNPEEDVVFLKDKLNTAQFYFESIWPRLYGLFSILEQSSHQVLEAYQPDTLNQSMSQ